MLFLSAETLLGQTSQKIQRDKNVFVDVCPRERKKYISGSKQDCKATSKAKKIRRIEENGGGGGVGGASKDKKMIDDPLNQ